ncbi:MAG: heparinase II/III family protein [Opitutaceae bacterium]|nr:heparinase II/III family protein [Opitutaceae bacterium]
MSSLFPVLFFPPADLPVLRRRFADDPRFAGVRVALQGCDRAAERRFLREEVDVTEPLLEFRRVYDRAQEMAFLYLMTGDEDAAELSLEGARTMMKFELWDFFMEQDSRTPMGNQRASAGIIALASVIDWLGDRVPADERAQWIEIMKERGCRPCAASLRRFANPLQAEPWTVNPATATARDKSRWTFPTDGQRRVEITAETNLRAAPTGALAIGVALLTHLGQKDAEVDEWAGLAADSIKIFNRLYLPDGSYGEGVNYANYTSESLFMGIEALRRAGQPDLSGGINWCAHARFMLNMAMPTRETPYDLINIGDAGAPRDKAKPRPESRSALPFWIAREYRDGTAQWFGENLAAAHNLWSLVFFDETVAPVAPANRPQSWHSDLHWMVARTGWRAQDLVVSLRSGIGWNHEHADRNSLIVKVHGEQLVVDPLRPPYNFTDPSWLLRTTLGHSAVLVDGRGHFYHNGIEGTCATIAQARIVQDASGPGHCVWISDATQAYRLVDVNIKSVVRAVVVLFGPQTVLVIDRVTKWREASTVEARFFADNFDGQAELMTAADGFSITRPHARADARIFCRHACRVSAQQLPIAPERAPKHPYIAIATEAVMATTLVTALRLTDGKAAPAEVALASTEERITATVGAIQCSIEDIDTVPIIRVSGDLPAQINQG